jgi:hypothetical protein
MKHTFYKEYLAHECNASVITWPYEPHMGLKSLPMVQGRMIMSYILKFSLRYHVSCIGSQHIGIFHRIFGP